ncbi:MAG: hypothetical protein OEU86_07150 [Gammaproteobacteria bacterium]|nr:hypothetical protein [Gammaproteobacteria bacterium]
MAKRNLKLRFLSFLLLMCLVTSLAWAQDGHEHHHHDHGGIPEMGPDGKRLDSYQVKHDMDQATLDALRDKIDLYRGMTDREINMNMSGMGPNYEWYASSLDLNGEVGVLILSHGVGQNSDRLLVEAIDPIASEKPTAVGFGMAMMTSSYLQSSVDDLTARGVKKIILLPNGTTTPYNSLTRQWKYIFGLGEEATYLEVPKIQSDAEFYMAEHFEDSPFITDILYDYAKEISTNPSNEVVVLIAHGPEDVEDNIPDLEILSAHAERIKEKGGFLDVKIANLQDDAIPPIRKRNVKQIQRWIRKANKKGNDVIVVALAAASHGVQTHIENDLRGLDYTFNAKGMAQHPLYITWMSSAINETAATLN